MKNKDSQFNFTERSPKGVSSRWDTLGLYRKTQIKSGPFVSRLRPEVGCVERVRPQKPERKPEPEIPILKGKNGYYFQPRVGGKFGKRVEISESLAKKLMA